MEDNLHPCCCGKDRMCNCYSVAKPNPDEKKEPLDYKLLKASTEIYKLCKPEPERSTDEQIVKRILKIARLLRDGGN